MRWSVAQGTLFIRAHADVSGENEAMVRGLLRLRDEVADLCTIQVTAFPQDGIFARDGDEERLENAIRLGVDCVGGIPHYEPTSELGLREVHRVFELAKQHSRRIDVHCDETDDPNSRFLEVMADDTVKFGLGGRVTASHCTAMGSYEPYYSSKLHGFLRRAGINIVVNPYANSLIQGRLDVYPKRRGFAQLKELLAAGVNVSLGNDVIMDPWYSLGRADMVEAASLALHFTYMSGREEIPEMLRCATERGARTLAVEDEYGIEEGKPADLVVFDAPSALEVLRLHAPRRWVIRRGRVVAETTPARTTLLGEPVTFTPPEARQRRLFPPRIRRRGHDKGVGMKRRILIGAAFVAVLAAAGTTYALAASGASTTQTINACVNGAGQTCGSSPLPAACRGNETPLSWNTVGPAGPQGAAGRRGPRRPAGAGRTAG